MDGGCLFALLPLDILRHFVKHYLTPMDQLLLRRTCKDWQQLIPVDQLKVSPGKIYWAMDTACKMCNVTLFDYLTEEYSMFSKMNYGYIVNDAQDTVEDICTHDSLEMFCSLQRHFEYPCLLDVFVYCEYDGRLWNFIKGAILLNRDSKWECLKVCGHEDQLGVDVDRVKKIDWVFENALSVGFIQCSENTQIKWLLEHFPKRMKKYFNISLEHYDDYNTKKRTAEECFPELFDTENRYPKRNKLMKRFWF